MLHQKPLCSENVTVWWGVSAFGVLGPYFFENASGQSVTVTSDQYVEDGATAHTTQNSMAVVRGMFP